MLAQSLVEYGALQSIASAFSNGFNRIDSLIGQGKMKYILLIVLAVVILMLVRKRRAY
jgi:hypothetical protein